MIKDISELDKEKSVFVHWSGGLDSTYLIWALLERGHSVKCAYTEIANNNEKTKIELERIEIMKEIFKNKYPNTFNYMGIGMKAEMNSPNSALMFSQVPIWMFSSVMASSECAYTAIGYCIGDVAISYLSEIENVYKSYSALAYSNYAELVFPLSKTEKETMIDELPKEILKQVWWCEHPRESGKRCKNCAPCMRYNGMGLKRRIKNRIKEAVIL